MTNTTSENELEVLKNTLTKLFETIASRSYGANLEFRLPTSYEDRVINSFVKPGNTMVSFAGAGIKGVDQTPLWIEQDKKGDFRVSILVKDYLSDLDTAHELTVPRDSVNDINQWHVAIPVLRRGTVKPANLSLLTLTSEKPEDRRRVVTLLMYDAISAIVKNDLCKKVGEVFKGPLHPKDGNNSTQQTVSVYQGQLTRR